MKEYRYELTILEHLTYTSSSLVIFLHAHYFVVYGFAQILFPVLSVPYKEACDNLILDTHFDSGRFYSRENG